MNLVYKMNNSFSEVTTAQCDRMTEEIREKILQSVLMQELFIDIILSSLTFLNLTQLFSSQIKHASPNEFNTTKHVFTHGHKHTHKVHKLN